MSNYVDLDSIWRDRIQYPNPCNYEVTPEQIKTWFASARAVRAYPQNVNNRPVDFVSTVKLQILSLPYDPTLAAIPRVYIDFHCKFYNDAWTIATISGVHKSARFIATFDKIQNDDSGAPAWIHYRCPMEQTLRVKRDDIVVLSITTRDQNPITIFTETPSSIELPPDPNRQSLATFEITPYLREGDYENHQLDPEPM